MKVIATPPVYNRGRALVMASHVSGIVQHIKASGGDVDAALAHAGITREDLKSPFNRIEVAAKIKLIDRAPTFTDDWHFGVNAGVQFLPQQSGPIGYLMKAEPTLFALIKRAVKNAPVFHGGLSIGVNLHPDVCWFFYRVARKLVPSPDLLTENAEFAMGYWCQWFRYALGEKWRPLEVHFIHAIRGDMAVYEAVFGAPVKFNRRINAIAFRRGDLDTPLPNPDPYLTPIMESALTSHYRLSEHSADFAGSVKSHLRMHLGERPATAEAMAKTLGLSDSLFQRWLKQSGVKFSDILSATREEIALDYLTNTDMPLTTIAYELGYSEPANFTRAFKAWTGLAPRDYRRKKNRTAQ